MRAFYLTPEQYLEIIEERDQVLKKVIELVRKHPNDMKLGSEIRNLFNDEANK